jgi:hypothetical protein
MKLGEMVTLQKVSPNPKMMKKLWLMFWQINFLKVDPFLSMQ